MKSILNLVFIISLGYGADYFKPDLYSLPRNQGNSNPFNLPEGTLKIIGIMAQFKFEDTDNSKTSGRGEFLTEETSYNFINSSIPRCDGLLLDSPPHDGLYFKRHLEAVENYYRNISNSTIDISGTVIMNSDPDSKGYYRVSKQMEYYAQGDHLLAEFFSEALLLAQFDIETFLDQDPIEDVLFVVFHAGLGQDFSYPSLDPTIYDLKSAYIDEEMMQGVTPTEILNKPIYSGIVLPETQNIIYYDVVEDIFGNPDFNTDDLCDIQIGMTGIFSMLLGYKMGLPPMFNVENGDPGVGLFGLMDYGSNNGQGVIPAPPTPWTRIKAGWSDVDTINIFNNNDLILINTFNQSNTIYQIDISENEYFLIENRNNHIIPGYDIEYLRYLLKDDYLCENCNLNCNGININEIIDNILIIEECIEDHPFSNDRLHYFDLMKTLIENMDPSLLNIDGNMDGNIFSGFKNYDMGLPGSGILIWHITEPLESDYYMGINNDRDKRAVHLEEADGAIDMGFESYLFGSNSNSFGWRWDYWYQGNMEYERFNSGSDSVLFNNWSIPNTRTSEGSESFLSVEVLSEISDSMYIRVIFDDGMDIIYLSDEPVQYLGNMVFNSMGSIFYEKQGMIYKHSFDGSIIIDMDDSYIEGELVYTSDGNICIDPGCNMGNVIQPTGYIEYVDSLTTEQGALSLGDLDGDGLDEIITIEEGDIIVKNSNGTLVNGFPVEGEFSGIPLIANILDIENNHPEIICREGQDIIILSNNGERLRRLSSLDADQPLAMVPHWGGKMALIDGARLFLFGLDMDHSYWLNPLSQPSGYPLSTGSHISASLVSQKAYNYPNPITEGHTKFRFFVENSGGNIQVRIYDVAGFLIKDDLELLDGNVSLNDWNEISWDNIQVDAGLYLAEIKRDIGSSELVRLVVLK